MDGGGAQFADREYSRWLAVGVLMPRGKEGADRIYRTFRASRRSVFAAPMIKKSVPITTHYRAGVRAVARLD